MLLDVVNYVRYVGLALNIQNTIPSSMSRNIDFQYRYVQAANQSYVNGVLSVKAMPERQ